MRLKSKRGDLDEEKKNQSGPDAGNQNDMDNQPADQGSRQRYPEK